MDIVLDGEKVVKPGEEFCIVDQDGNTHNMKLLKEGSASVDFTAYNGNTVRGPSGPLIGEDQEREVFEPTRGILSTEGRFWTQDRDGSLIELGRVANLWLTRRSSAR